MNNILRKTLQISTAALLSLATAYSDDFSMTAGNFTLTVNEKGEATEL